MKFLAIALAAAVSMESKNQYSFTENYVDNTLTPNLVKKICNAYMYVWNSDVQLPEDMKADEMAQLRTQYELNPSQVKALCKATGKVVATDMNYIWNSDVQTATEKK